MPKVDITAKDETFRTTYQGRYTGKMVRNSGGYWDGPTFIDSGGIYDHDVDFAMALCWIAKPATICEKLTCDTKLHIDTDETHADLTF